MSSLIKLGHMDAERRILQFKTSVVFGGSPRVTGKAAGEQMRITTCDLGRIGTLSGPNLDGIRPYVDYEPVILDSMPAIQGRAGGASTFAPPWRRLKASGSIWWRLPRGTEYPQSLFVWNDRKLHWVWEAAWSMSLEEYVALLVGMNEKFVPAE